MRPDENPFRPKADPDRHAIWEMLVRLDIEGFVACDWSDFGARFRSDGFLGLDAGGSLDPEVWQPRYAGVAAYRDAWMTDARKAAGTRYGEPLREALYRATNMHDIRISGESATARKTFNDAILLADGSQQLMKWQSVFFCTRDNGDWLITGFVGFLPFPQATAVRPSEEHGDRKSE